MPTHPFAGKCRGCTGLCPACTAQAPGDIGYEGCEPWCSDPGQCATSCKCRGCAMCKGHHPERPCTPIDTDDANFETCQPWCDGSPHHCRYCKCKGCKSCSAEAAASCTPKDRTDLYHEECQGWCQGAHNCGYCKCKACSVCPRCSAWCRSIADCGATACFACDMCAGVAPVVPLRCESWCTAERCGKAGGACDGCAVCGTPQRPPPALSPPPSPQPPDPHLDSHRSHDKSSPPAALKPHHDIHRRGLPPPPSLTLPSPQSSPQSSPAVATDGLTAQQSPPLLSLHDSAAGLGTSAAAAVQAQPTPVVVPASATAITSLAAASISASVPADMMSISWSISHGPGSTSQFGSGGGQLSRRLSSWRVWFGLAAICFLCVVPCCVCTRVRTPRQQSLRTSSRRTYPSRASHRQRHAPDGDLSHEAQPDDFGEELDGDGELDELAPKPRRISAKTRRLFSNVILQEAQSLMPPNGRGSRKQGR